MESGFTPEKQAYTLCRHIGLLLGKRLDTILLRHRIRKYPDRYRIRCSFIFSTLESELKNTRIRCRIRRMRVDGSRIRNEKVADSKISGYVGCSENAECGVRSLKKKLKKKLKKEIKKIEIKEFKSKSKE